MLVCARQPHDFFDKVVDVVETAGLAAIAINGQRLSAQNLRDEIHDHPPVVGMQRTDRIHIVPVALRLRMLDRIAVAFRGRGVQDSGTVTRGDLEHVLDADRAHAQRFDGQVQILRRAGRRGEIEDVFDWAGIERLANVALFKAEMGLARRTVPVGGQIVSRPRSDQSRQQPGQTAGSHRPHDVLLVDDFAIDAQIMIVLELLEKNARLLQFTVETVWLDSSVNPLNNGEPT